MASYKFEDVYQSGVERPENGMFQRTRCEIAMTHRHFFTELPMFRIDEPLLLLKKPSLNDLGEVRI